MKPSGRNGHSATLLGGSILILGGWLGNGPLAAGVARSKRQKRSVQNMATSTHKKLEIPVYDEYN